MILSLTVPSSVVISTVAVAEEPVVGAVGADGACFSLRRYPHSACDVSASSILRRASCSLHGGAHTGLYSRMKTSNATSVGRSKPLTKVSATAHAAPLPSSPEMAGGILPMYLVARLTRDCSSLSLISMGGLSLISSAPVPPRDLAPAISASAVAVGYCVAVRNACQSSALFSTVPKKP